MPDTELTYVFAVGKGALARKSLYLTRSIRRHVEDPDIIAFVVDDERPDIDPDILDEIGATARVEYGEMPNEDYPLSASHAALARAAEVSESEYLLLLDSDTLVLDDISVHERSDADMFLKPVDVGNTYWGRPESHEEWRGLYDDVGHRFPDERTVSTVDRVRTIPYYNGGVILTRNNDFPERWLELCLDLHGSITNGFYTEQVALALLSADYTVNTLDESFNYPLHLRWYCPSTTAIVHYHEYRHLLKVPNPTVLREASAVGMTKDLLGDLPWLPRALVTTTYFRLKYGSKSP